MRLIPLLGFFLIALLSKSLHHVNAYSLGVRNSPLGMTTNGILRRDTGFIYSSFKERADSLNPRQEKQPKKEPKNEPKKEPKNEPKDDPPPKKEPKQEPKDDPPPKKEPKQEPKDDPPPKQDPPKQDPPKQDPPKQDPPKQDPPKQDPKVTPADDSLKTSSIDNATSKSNPPPSAETAKSVNDQSQFKNSDSGASESVPTEPISWTTIIVLSSIGGLIVVAVILFAFIRRKRRREMANNIVATSSVAWEQQNNAYEKMEEDDEPPSLGSFTVVASYTPSLDDELEIQPGDKVTVLVEYDDGWVNGINESRGGAKGVFPRHCVDMNSVLNNKRSSSMAYTMVNLN